MKKTFLKLSFAYCLLFIAYYSQAQTNYAKIVNPFIGTGGHGHTFPGAVAPFGMVQLSPDTRIDGSWDGCSGYHHSDSVIYGFSHTHLSGTGCSDYGDIMIMPMMGEPSFDHKKYSSKYSHQNEKANAGYYSVHLDDDDIDVELTTTTRVGLHRYTFNKSGKMNIILDLLHRDKLLEGNIKIVNGTTLEGYRRSEAWAKDQIVFYRIEFSKPFTGRSLRNDGKALVNAGAFEFDVKKGEQIFVKVSISGVDEEGAAKNMQAELPHWNFEKVRTDCEALWNKELDKIQVKGGTTDQQVIFYTALYHCFIHPSIYNDVDGRYLGRDMKIHKAEGFNYYTVFSLWDTFRALHPLFNIVQRERNLDFIKTFLEQYKQVGRLPMWELSSNETNCMIGNHAISVIADAYAKGIRGFDINLAIEACEKTANIAHLGMPEFRKKGYLEVEDEHESVSKTLEYAYNDWCIEMLKAEQDGNSYNLSKLFKFIKYKPDAWKELYDVDAKFMRPRSNGGWYSPFNPSEVNNHFTEANSWQYSFFVPHDIDGMIYYSGGKEKFEKRLDDLFNASTKTSGREQADITGLIGQYAHGNEPSHHMAYLYNYIGKPDKTQQRVSQILKEMYANAPDGLAGNEDCGQMSAWYVMSAMGIYDVCPGGKEYNLGYSIFEEVSLSINNKKIKLFKEGSLLKLEKDNKGKKVVNTRHYKDTSIVSSNLFNTYYLFNTDLYNTSIVFNDNFYQRKTVEVICEHWSDASASGDTIVGYKSPYTFDPYLKAPLILSNTRNFKDSLQLSIKTFNDFYSIIYLINTKGDTSIMVKDNANDLNLTINQATNILVKSYNNCSVIQSGKSCKDSSYAFASFYKIPHNWTVKLNCKYNKQYTAGGDAGIIDGLSGYKDWRKGGWQGYQSQDFEAVVDLQAKKEINEISSNYLQDSRSWILLPKEVEYFISNDGINFKSVGTLNHNLAWNTEETFTKNFIYQLPKKVKARYVKVVAKNFGVLPQGHQGAGGDAFIFVDEIEVK
jgi:predicted alpha-1,2-mannosidase